MKAISFIKRTIAVASALALVFTATVGFSAFNNLESNNKVQTSQWFSTNALGQPMNALDTPPTDCPKLTTPNCAKQYAAESLYEENGEVKVIPGQENNFIDHRSLRP
ncbi:MAG TPA: hypothetical protein VKZ57_11610 [Sphingobacterium sp.]|nr:hypothetical protein [Sphingobacterium sp.]